MKSFQAQTPDSTVTVNEKTIEYFPDKKVVTIDSSLSDFKISGPHSAENNSLSNTIEVDESEMDSPASTNPARINYRGTVKCAATNGGKFYVESVSDMSMSFVNGSHTVYHHLLGQVRK